MGDTTRRQYLRAVGVAGLASLAGCSSLTGGGEPTPTSRTPPPTTGTDTSDLTDVRTQTATLATADGDSGDTLGLAAAVSGDGSTAVVGAPSETGPTGAARGAAYVFERSGDTWRQRARLTPINDGTEDRFGFAVAVSADGTTALIGAVVDPRPNGTEAGSAYVFERSGDTWRQQAKLIPDDGDPGDRFGVAGAMSADGATAVIGAHNDADPNGASESPFGGAGAAYVFDGTGDAWTQQAKLAPADGDPADNFGNVVTVSGDGTTAIVGAVNDEDSNGLTRPRAGSAYVFERTNAGWRERATLAAAADTGDNFGRSVAVSADGSTAVVGAHNDDGPNGEDAGAAYVFKRTPDAWRERARLAPVDGDPEDNVGNAVAVSRDGRTAVVGALSDASVHGARAGAAYVFERSGDTWRQRATLAPEDGDPGDRFGAAVGLADDGSAAVVGAPYDADPNGDNAGAAYTFALA